MTARTLLLLASLVLPGLALAQARAPSGGASPPASPSTSGLVTTGAQTFAGVKTFTSKITTTLIGNTFAAGFGIEFPDADNTIYYRTGSVFGGAHIFTDLGGNIYGQTIQDGIHVGGSTNTTATLWFRYSSAAGAPGAATVNKPGGRAAIASGASSAVITNSVVAATSIVGCKLETPNVGVSAVLCPAASGSFTATAVDGAGVPTNVTGNATFSFIVLGTE